MRSHGRHNVQSAWSTFSFDKVGRKRMPLSTMAEEVAMRSGSAACLADRRVAGLRVVTPARDFRNRVSRDQCIITKDPSQNAHAIA